MIRIRLARQTDNDLPKPIGVSEPLGKVVRIPQHRDCDLNWLSSRCGSQDGVEIVLQIFAQGLRNTSLFVGGDLEILGVNLLDDPDGGQGDQDGEYEERHRSVNAQYPCLLALTGHSRGSSMTDWLCLALTFGSFLSGSFP